MFLLAGSDVSHACLGKRTLWMSATPRPRTLATGLTGLRGLCVIAPPPLHRVPVVTKVAPLSDIAIAGALYRSSGDCDHAPVGPDPELTFTIAATAILSSSGAEQHRCVRGSRRVSGCIG
ncbi:protein of unknown function [Bradyrhizobium sp. ORS 285]|nr:hypothetical protein BRAO285_880007 [Bradyrhizobium sp. ORS 285]SMX61273.1 protein of unknown function [Bradyrhizobium sp. ORS 285]